MFNRPQVLLALLFVFTMSLRPCHAWEAHNWLAGGGTACCSSGEGCTNVGCCSSVDCCCSDLFGGMQLGLFYLFASEEMPCGGGDMYSYLLP